VYRGLVISAMIAAGSLQSAPHSSPVASFAGSLPDSRGAIAPNDEININIAKLAGRVALPQPPQAPLSREEMLSILLLISQRPLLKHEGG
jgi:hypothetical protein